MHATGSFAAPAGIGRAAGDKRGTTAAAAVVWRVREIVLSFPSAKDHSARFGFRASVPEVPKPANPGMAFAEMAGQSAVKTGEYGV